MVLRGHDDAQGSGAEGIMNLYPGAHRIPLRILLAGHGHRQGERQRTMAWNCL